MMPEGVPRIEQPRLPHRGADSCRADRGACNRSARIQHRQLRGPRPAAGQPASAPVSTRENRHSRGWRKGGLHRRACPRYGGLMLRPGSWTRPAGESPVRVSTRAPGSRPRSGGESPQAERGVKSLYGGSKNAGRSRKASPAASSNKQWGSRAAHATVKATSGGSKRDCDQPGSSGVRGAARVQGLGTEQERPVCAALSAKTVRISRR
jgi:hypothetical protein